MVYASCVAAAGLTAMLVEVVLVKPLLVKRMVMLVAMLWERLVNVTKPATDVAVSVPCKVPLPALRAAVTTELLSEVIKLPEESSIRMTGCWTKVWPAVAVEEGWVRMVSLLAAAGATLMLPEVCVERPGAEKLILMVSARV